MPIGNIEFFADPALVGKWHWMPDGDGKIRTSVPLSERSVTIKSLQTYGITPSSKNVGSEKEGCIVVAGDDKEKLNNVIQQHLLQQRSSNLLSFAEALPSYASTIAVAAYKDACVYLFGLRQNR